MTDRPILFSAPMVRALLDGRKHQTRRVLKPQPGGGYMAWQDEDTKEWLTSGYGEAGDWGPLAVRFRKGDRLWVKETWRTEARHDAVKPTGLPRDALISYDADYMHEPNDGCRGRTRVSIHMPRWASRLTLTVTDVRVQRLQEISDADAIAEGIERRSTECSDGVTRSLWYGVPECGTEHAVTSYSHLWDSINNPRALCPDDAPNSWDANPWIVALTFTVERRNIDTARAA